MLPVPEGFLPRPRAPPTSLHPPTWLLQDGPRAHGLQPAVSLKGTVPLPASGTVGVHHGQHRLLSLRTCTVCLDKVWGDAEFHGPRHAVGFLQPDTQGGCWELQQIEIPKFILPCFTIFIFLVIVMFFISRQHPSYSQNCLVKGASVIHPTSFAACPLCRHDFLSVTRAHTLLKY